LELAFWILQESAYWNACDVYCTAFGNISLVFSKTVSNVRLMKEVLDVNITDFGKGTASQFAVLTATVSACQLVYS
jgi:hypothetical protein